MLINPKGGACSRHLLLSFQNDSYVPLHKHGVCTYITSVIAKAESNGDVSYNIDFCVHQTINLIHMICT